MPYNPSTSRAECNLHAGMVNQDSINDPRLSNNESYNSFDKTCIKLDTQLFDEIRVCYTDTAESGDVKRIDIMQDLRSPVLKSPLLTPVHMHRSFFQVPWSVIMPNTWEYVYRNPVKGEDIIFDDVAPLIKLSSFFTFLNDIKRRMSAGALTAEYLDFFVRYVYFIWSAFGRGSLPRQLKCRIGNLPVFATAPSTTGWPSDVTKFGEFNDPDVLMEWLCALLLGEVVVPVSISDNGFSPESIYTSGGALSVNLFFSDASTSLRNTYVCKSRGDVFNFLREYILHGIPGSLVTPTLSSDSNIYPGLLSVLPTFLTSTNKTYNLMPLIAYQCVVAQFFTNDHVDAVYSAKMWQQNALSSVLYRFSSSVPGPESSFTINGVDVPYDAYSGAILKYYFALDYNGADTSAILLPLFSYLQNLFLVGQSLRYGDYFTSARTQPLAVGDVTAAVNDSMVSAVDVNRALWSQRLLNAINRTKQSIYDYMQSLTGVLPARREPQPNFIITEDYRIGGMEVENTADNQGNIITLFRNTESKRAYDVYIDEPSFIIGVDYFSAAVVYPDARMKITDMQDRFDWFNHFMQHIGDQIIDRDELASQRSMGIPFAYQLRYAEFKFSISDACGGFLFDDSQLDSWALQFHPENGGMYTFGSMFIRNHNADFDNFFASLTAADSSRYHFIKFIYFRDMTNSKQQAFPSLL